MSRFIKKLRQISESAAAPLGFKTTAISPNQLMLLIAFLTKGDSSEAAQLAEAKVDAILMHSQDLEKELETIQKVSGQVGDIPWGIYPEAISDKGVEGLRGIGGDFLIFGASEAPASLLQEEIGKVMKVNLPCEEGLIGTLNQLAIDAVLLDFREEGENLTISQLMNCQWISGSTNKPLLIAVQQVPSDKEMQALWEVGVKGLVVEVEGNPMQELTRLRQAIATLSSSSKKTGERRAILPPVEGEED